MVSEGKHLMQISIKIEIKEEKRIALEPFGSLIVNDLHVWRFDTVNQATLVAENLKKAITKGIEL